jgi:hypothetical protein
LAIRTKTIEYAFDRRNTTLAAGTRHDFAAITINIPETTSRAFLSVMVLTNFREDHAAGGTNAGDQTIAFGSADEGQHPNLGRLGAAARVAASLYLG